MLSSGILTEYLIDATLSPTVAVIVASPSPTAFTTPLSTVTASGLSDFQVTVLSSVVSSGSYTTTKVSDDP